MTFEAFTCKRFVKVTQTRTRIDFAECIKELVDIHYSHAEKIIVVMDNLNTHGSLHYKVILSLQFAGEEMDVSGLFRFR